MSDFDKQESEWIESVQKTPADDAPSPTHRDTLRERALAAFDQALAAQAAATSSPPSPAHPPVLRNWRELMRRPISRVIAAAVVCLAVAAPWLLMPGHSSAVFAFNQLAATLVEARTARFQMEVKIQGLPPQKIRASYLAPGRFRQESPLGGITIADESTGQSVTLTPAAKTALVVTGQNRPPGETPKDPFIRLRELLSGSRDAKPDPFRPIGEKEIGGKKVVGFQSESATGRFTLWGDPATGLPVRVEAAWTGSPATEAVMTDFEINVPLDAALFELTPPAGYKVQSFQVDLSKPGEADLIEAFRACQRLSGGLLPDSIGPISQATFIGQHTKERFKTLKPDQTDQIMKEIAPIPRGFRFAWELPAEAEAHYAGKGAKPGAAARPIFWYRPVGAKMYRVVHDDLSIREAEAAPQVEGAERLGGPQGAANPAAK